MGIDFIGISNRNIEGIVNDIIRKAESENVDIPALLRLIEELAKISLEIANQELEEQQAESPSKKRVDSREDLLNSFSDLDHDISLPQSILTYELVLAINNAVLGVIDHLQEYDLGYWAHEMGHLDSGNYILKQTLEKAFTEEQEIVIDYNKVDFLENAVKEVLIREVKNYGPNALRNKLLQECEGYKLLLLEENPELQIIVDKIEADDSQYVTKNEPFIRRDVDYHLVVNQYMTLKHIQAVLRSGGPLDAALEYIHDVVDAASHHPTYSSPAVVSSSSVWKKIVDKLKNILSTITSVLVREKFSLVLSHTEETHPLVYDPKEPLRARTSSIGSMQEPVSKINKSVGLDEKPRRVNVIIKENIQNFGIWNKDHNQKKDPLDHPGTTGEVVH